MSGNGDTDDVTAFRLSAEVLDDKQLVAVAVEASQVLERTAKAVARAMVDPTVDPKAAAAQVTERAALAQRKVAGVIYAIASELIARRDAERTAEASATSDPPTDADLDRIERCLPERDAGFVAGGLMEVTTREGRIESFDSDDVRSLVDEVRRLRRERDEQARGDHPREAERPER